MALTISRPKPFESLPRRVGARRLFAAVALISVSATSAACFNVGLSAGADLGRVDCIASTPCQRSSTQWKLFAGHYVTEAIEVQAVLFDGGPLQGRRRRAPRTRLGGTFKVSGFGLTADYRQELAPAWNRGTVG